MPSFLRFRSFHRTSRKLVETSPLKPMGVISKGGKKKKTHNFGGRGARERVKQKNVSAVSSSLGLDKKNNF